MYKESYGAVQALYTKGFGIFGVRARVVLPNKFEAHGHDTDHYFDAYVAFFTTNFKNNVVEAGPTYYGDYHQDKGSNVHYRVPSNSAWVIGVNPLGGTFRKSGKHGERTKLYMGPSVVNIEVLLPSRNTAEVSVNGQKFMTPTPNDFTYGDHGHGVEDATFEKGFNLKACIGLNDIGGKGVNFSDMSITVLEVLQKVGSQKVWKSPPALHQSFPLMNTKTIQMGPRLTVSYPAEKPR